MVGAMVGATVANSPVQAAGPEDGTESAMDPLCRRMEDARTGEERFYVLLPMDQCLLHGYMYFTAMAWLRCSSNCVLGSFVRQNSILPCTYV